MLKWFAIPLCLFALLSEFALAQNIAEERDNAPAARSRCRTTSGTVEAGKYADIIAVQSNPLNDISVMQKIIFVMKSGVVFKK